MLPTQVKNPVKSSPSHEQITRRKGARSRNALACSRNQPPNMQNKTQHQERSQTLALEPPEITLKLPGYCGTTQNRYRAFLVCCPKNNALPPDTFRGHDLLLLNSYSSISETISSGFGHLERTIPEAGSPIFTCLRCLLEQPLVSPCLTNRTIVVQGLNFS